MSESCQQKCERTVIGRERLTMESIRRNLIANECINAQLKPNILLTALMHAEEKNDVEMSKAAGVLSKPIDDQYQPIIEGKTPIGPLFRKDFNTSTQQAHHGSSTKRQRRSPIALVRYTSTSESIKLHLTRWLTSCVIRPPTVAKAQRYTFKPLLMNIGTEYTTLVSAIEKNCQDEATNRAETFLQTIRHHEFMEGNENL